MKKIVFVYLTLSVVYQEKSYASDWVSWFFGEATDRRECSKMPLVSQEAQFPIFPPPGLISPENEHIKNGLRGLLGRKKGQVSYKSWSANTQEILEDSFAWIWVFEEGLGSKYISDFSSDEEGIKYFELKKDEFLFIRMNEILGSPEAKNAFLKICFYENHIDFLTKREMIDILNVSSSQRKRREALGYWLFYRLKEMKKATSPEDYKKDLYTEVSRSLSSHFPGVLDEFLQVLRGLDFNSPHTKGTFNAELEKLFSHEKVIEIRI